MISSEFTDNYDIWLEHKICKFLKVLVKCLIVILSYAYSITSFLDMFTARQYFFTFGDN